MSTSRFLSRICFLLLKNSKPQVLLVSIGFDAHAEDDMADISVTTEGYTRMMQTAMRLAAQYCGGRLISILEGGYCLERLPELGANHVRVLPRHIK